MVILRLSGFLLLGTITLRIPFFIEALTLSWSTRFGKVKVRENWPTLRSETQYLAAGFLELPPSPDFSTEVSDLLPFSFSSLAFPSPPSVIEPWGPDPSTKPLGGVPELYERSVWPWIVNVWESVNSISTSYCSMPGSSP